MEIARTAASFLPRLPSSVNGGSLTGPLTGPLPGPSEAATGPIHQLLTMGILRSSRHGCLRIHPGFTAPSYHVQARKSGKAT